MRRHWLRDWLFAAVLGAALLSGARPARAQGVVQNGIGPVNLSMGGASTAAPLDAIGTVLWNPATMGGLQRSEMELGVMIELPHSSLSSRIDLGGLTSLLPPNFPVAGTTNSDVGFAPLPAVAVVYQPEESRWTAGLGVLPVAGSSLSYPGDPTNPILSAPPPHGVGVGPIASVLDILQFPISVSYRLTDHLWVGGGPMLDVGLIVADTGLISAPDHADRDSFPAYPPATHSRFSWGAGFQAGAYYATDAGWNFGASVKSPQWFAPYLFDSHDEAGNPRSLSFRLDFPLIVSLGAAYQGFERWLLAVDVRWLDYKDARGFGPAGFEPDFAVRGLGWQSIWMVALGAQYQVTDALSVRAGYTGTQNPVPAALSTFNIPAPAIIEHIVSAGASYQVSRSLSVSLAYAHGFENSISGPLATPFGSLPFVTIQSKASYDALLFGLSVLF